MAPWNLSWGSATHALLEPLGIPRTFSFFLTTDTVLGLVQIIWSSVISAPLYPFLGSTVFLTSYGRPVKFWERSYRTDRVGKSFGHRH